MTPTSEGELLVGTVKNFILSGKPEGPAEEFKVLVSGHSDELWGLAVHPQRHQFLTGCYDKTLILWDALTHSAIWTKEINVRSHMSTGLFLSVVRFFPEAVRLTNLSCRTRRIRRRSIPRAK